MYCIIFEREREKGNFLLCILSISLVRLLVVYQSGPKVFHSLWFYIVYFSAKGTSKRCFSFCILFPVAHLIHGQPSMTCFLSGRLTLFHLCLSFIYFWRFVGGEETFLFVAALKITWGSHCALFNLLMRSTPFSFSYWLWIWRRNLQAPSEDNRFWLLWGAGERLGFYPTPITTPKPGLFALPLPKSVYLTLQVFSTTVPLAKSHYFLHWLPCLPTCPESVLHLVRSVCKSGGRIPCISLLAYFVSLTLTCPHTLCIYIPDECPRKILFGEFILKKTQLRREREELSWLFLNGFVIKAGDWSKLYLSLCLRGILKLFFRIFISQEQLITISPRHDRPCKELRRLIKSFTKTLCA